MEHGRSACCEVPVNDPGHYKRESQPEQRRRLPSSADREACLESQGHRCLYCDHRFGHAVLDGTRLIQLRIEWDHFVPYSFNQDNHGRNFVASCQVCNRIKRDRIFGTVEEVRAFVAAQKA